MTKEEYALVLEAIQNMRDIMAATSLEEVKRLGEKGEEIAEKIKATVKEA